MFPKSKTYGSDEELVRKPKQYNGSAPVSGAAAAPAPKPAANAPSADKKVAAGAAASETSRLNPNTPPATTWKQKANAVASEFAEVVEGAFFGVKKGGDGYRQIGNPTGANGNATAEHTQTSASNSNPANTQAKFF